MEEEIEETEQHSETVGDPEDDLFPDESVPLSPDSNLFGSAKDAVLNIVKQAAKVFTGPSDGMASTEPHEAKGKVSVEKTFLEPTLEYPEPCLAGMCHTAKAGVCHTAKAGVCHTAKAGCVTQLKQGCVTQLKQGCVTQLKQGCVTQLKQGCVTQLKQDVSHN
ncbi:hypothetical protein Bbelb_252790 [Branchiostoma belcheri]|nr:hypothetical protein Bbelb_252790 [Branchiostoma belcheri]